MKERINMIVVLTLFGLASGLVLAWTDSATRAPIREARRMETLGALQTVLPACDNDVVADARTFENSGRVWTNYVARLTGAYAGAAFESETDGYGGPIRLMVGVRADGSVNGIEILLADKETPGLGSKIREPAFRKQFMGRGAADTKWCEVKKDGGELDAITGATISSRAVAKAVKAGLDAHARHMDEVKAAAPANK
jgi:Na+-translocating ferredoxin:NAD+ oxidoreductase subunit G